MKTRNPFAVWIGLPLITLGIYHFVWYYKVHRELANFDRRRNAPVAGPMLVLLLLGWTVIAPLVSYYNTGNRIKNAQRAAGVEPTCSAVVGLLLCFVFGLESLYYQQDRRALRLHAAWNGRSPGGMTVQTLTVENHASPKNSERQAFTRRIIRRESTFSASCPVEVEEFSYSGVLARSRYASAMGKLKNAVEGLFKRKKAIPEPAPKQLDRWADEGGALPPEPPRDPGTR